LPGILTALATLIVAITGLLQVIPGILETTGTPSSPETSRTLIGVRRVYIHYYSSKELAEKIQKDLQDKNILVPGIEQVYERIEQNNMRYANPVDKQAAEDLQVYLERSQDIKFKQPVDLSSIGYNNSPVGQFEIWLK
jgi:hypothetical protein